MCTALLFISKSRVEKIICDELSVNMVAMPAFGTPNLLWPRARELKQERSLCHKEERKQIAISNYP